MSKIVTLFILLTSILFAEIDERKSDIYYGNGIFARSIAPAMECLEHKISLHVRI